MKICSDCNKEKELAEFYTRPDTVNGGYQSYCIECCKRRKRIWYEKRKRDHDVRFKNLKSHAKQRHIGVKLTFEEYSAIISNSCHYCDESIVNHVGSGIDRLDSDGDYTKDNSVACCTTCNLGKGEYYTHDEWMVMIKALIKFRKKNGGEQSTRNSIPV